MITQPEALRLADSLDNYAEPHNCNEDAAAELRRQHTEIEHLTAERDALARCKLADQDAYVAMRDQRDAALADAKRLEWLSQQGVSFGFQDIYEGNKWEIGGPYATLRIAIDAEMKGEQP